MTSSGPAAVAGPAAPVTPAPARVPWPTRRMLPLLATAALIAISMGSSTWWGPLITGARGWPLPGDLWGTLVAARRLAHLDLGGLYTQPTGLVGFPGTAVILIPVAALISAAGISLQDPGPHNLHPAAWLLAGPYEIAVASVALFAADALAERLGVTRPRRALLAAASAVALWSVASQWGHPEDPVAVGLLLYGVLALSRARTARSAWLVGAAVAVQPLVLVALPVILVAIEPRRVAGFLARAATPGVVLLAAAVAANRAATVHAVTNQPNWPKVDHPTPWTSLAPHLAGGAVAAGPFRALAIGVACVVALIAGRRWRAARGAAWSPGTLQDVLWWTAAVLALRSVFESVMVAYYLWPVLAVALIAAARNWVRLAATSVVVVAISFAAQLNWRGPWSWWTAMIAGLALTLFCARLPPALRRFPPALRRFPSRLRRPSRAPQTAG